MEEHSSAGNVRDSMRKMSALLKWVELSCQILSALEKWVFDKDSIAGDVYLRESINFSSFIFKFALMFYR